MKLCCCNICSMWFCIILLKYTSSGRGACVALKPLYTLQHSLCLPNHASCPYHMFLCTPIPSEMLMTCWKVSLLFSPEDTAPVISNKNVKFGLVLTTVEHFETVHFKLALAHRTQRRFWTMFQDSRLYLSHA